MLSHAGSPSSRSTRAGKAVMAGPRARNRLFEPEPATFFAIHPVGRAQSRKVALFVDELAGALKHIPA